MDRETRILMSQRDPSDEEMFYRGELRRHSLAVWAAGKRSFGSICRRLHGAFPSDVAQAVLEIGGTVAQSCGTREFPAPLEAIVPEPLLIDYDWRFDGPSARYLIRKLRSFRRILCVGTPTVFLELVSLRKNAVLVDINDSLVSADIQWRGPGIESSPRQIRYSVRRMIRNPETVMSTFATIQ
jgi:hypothetical protein